MNRRSIVLPLAAAALLSLAGCTNTTTGTGTPLTSAGHGIPTSQAGDSGLVSIQPCNIFSSAELSENNLTNAHHETGAGARSCGWSNYVADNGLGYSIGVDIRDSQGLKDVVRNGFSVKADPVGNHQGKQARETSGDGCVVAIGVTETSRVDVTVATGSSNVDESCTIANKFAKYVEQKLP